MANIIRRPAWFIPDRDITPESAYRNRRRFLAQLGLGAAFLPFLPSATRAADAAASARKGYPYTRNNAFNPAVRLTDESVVTSYNNFYEFSLDKESVRLLTGKFITSPWPIEVKGLCDYPMKIDVDELVSQMPMEERVYRLRCVEAWSMVVPWTGFPLSKLIEKAKPKAEAKFIRFETANRPDQFPGYSNPRTAGYPWPYFEALRMDEAMNPLTLLATGIYGKTLPKQNGAPARLVVPWKYGYKSIKSVVKIEFVATQPKTFWETLGPDEYPFESNVNPRVPHPRWSQATERIVDTGDRIRTQLYNGYGEYVAKLYPGA
ncbi:MAG: protein-methionine-sulfoxide reductase catalytic subunit MsrP [Verrucomicrobia bacterium]|nr:protein-methionine-sulfoxide reductase catalytic subunit MsrP [Verrucomicrobiota bacterium]MBI3871180.1 protein-methionine-sulfoxide reductase catalytic subunit MsrP [Verrucomicrobiota bacterium]